MLYESKSNYSCAPFTGAESKCNLFSRAGKYFSLKNCSEEFSSILVQYWAGGGILYAKCTHIHHTLSPPRSISISQETKHHWSQNDFHFLDSFWFSGDFDSQRTYCAKYDRLAGGDEVFCDQLHYATVQEEDDDEVLFTFSPLSSQFSSYTCHSPLSSFLTMRC